MFLRHLAIVGVAAAFLWAARAGAAPVSTGADAPHASVLRFAEAELRITEVGVAALILLESTSKEPPVWARVFAMLVTVGALYGWWRGKRKKRQRHEQAKRDEQDRVIREERERQEALARQEREQRDREERERQEHLAQSARMQQEERAREAARAEQKRLADEERARARAKAMAPWIDEIEALKSNGYPVPARLRRRVMSVLEETRDLTHVPQARELISRWRDLIDRLRERKRDVGRWIEAYEGQFPYIGMLEDELVGALGSPGRQLTEATKSKTKHWYYYRPQTNKSGSTEYGLEVVLGDGEVSEYREGTFRPRG